ncbi:hypothetical protein [Rhodococcus sp. NPDC003348]
MKQTHIALAAVGLAALVSVGATGCGADKPPTTFEMRGSVIVPTYELTGGGSVAGDLPCVGSGRFANVRPGTTVTVLDDAGKILATGSVEQGLVGGESYGIACSLKFKVPGVPDGPGRYRVEVNGHPAQVVESKPLLVREARIELS